jgi:MFS transporter, DHA2 family, multidrug resistance protein
MSYLSGSGSGGLEAWEQEYGNRLSASLAELSQPRRLAILLSVGLVTAIEISNRISINVLLPDMQGNVAASTDEISWVIILYNLGFLCSLALSSWITFVLGARRHLLYSILLYSIGGVGCALSAHSLRLLLISRVIMGFGGGAFLVRAVILAGLMFPGKARIYAVTRLYLVLFAFQMTYPIMMGWITDTLQWNYAFCLDFPFLIVGAILIWKLVPRGYLYLRRAGAEADKWGAVLLVVSLVALQIGLSRGERDLWLESPLIVGSLIIAVGCFVAFLWWDSRVDNPSPVLHLRTVWREAELRTSVFLVMAVGAILGCGLFVLPQYLRYVQDYSATQTGEFIVMYTSGLGFGLLLTLQVIQPRIGGPRTAALGLVLLIGTFTTFLYIWTPTTPGIVLAPAIFLQGFALAPILVAASNIATGQAALADLNDISTTYFFVRQLGNTFGVTAATVIFDRRMTLHSTRLLDVANRLDPTVQSTLAAYSGLIARNGGAGSNPALGALQLFQADVITQSRLLSYIDIYLVLAVLSAVAVVLLAMARLRPAKDLAHWHFL